MKKKNHKPLSIEPKKSEDPSDRATDSNLIVSNLIANYLKDLSNRPNAGYSIRYDSEKDCYTIGNKWLKLIIIS